MRYLIVISIVLQYFLIVEVDILGKSLDVKEFGKSNIFIKFL